MTIQADDLTVQYGRNTIIDAMSFAPLDGGKVVGLLGPNAAGKSTLVKTLAGVKKAASGSCTVTIDGQEVKV